MTRARIPGAPGATLTLAATAHVPAHAQAVRSAAEGLWGKPFESLGLASDDSRRTLMQLLPSLGWRLLDSGAEIEVTGRFSVAGRNLPSGPAVTAGFTLPWVL